jgi:hypothetical protein
MASPFRSEPQAKLVTTHTAALVELSLRNHLCFLALRTEHGTAFHLGTIVRTMFNSFFLFDAGFGTGKVSTFTDADLALGEIVSSGGPNRRWSVNASAATPIAQLLRLFDSQLQTTPVNEIVAANRRAEANFKAPLEQRLSIPELVQRSQCGIMRLIRP